MSGLTIDIAALFRLHQKELQGFLRKRGASPEPAADLTQEAFLRLLSMPAEASVANSAAYLFRTAANLSVDWRRRQRFLPLAAAACCVQPARTCDAARSARTGERDDVRLQRRRSRRS